MHVVEFWLENELVFHWWQSVDSWKSDVSRLECEIERVYYSGYGRVMMDDVCSRWGWIVWGKNGFRTLKIWFLASATASNRLLYDANRLLGFENVIFHFCLSANRLLYDANRLHCLKNVILALGTASNRLLSSANRLLTVCRTWKLQKFITFEP